MIKLSEINRGSALNDQGSLCESIATGYSSVCESLFSDASHTEMPKDSAYFQSSLPESMPHPTWGKILIWIQQCRKLIVLGKAFHYMCYLG